MTVILDVSVTVRVPVRYVEPMVEVHLYSPASLRLSGLKVMGSSREYSVPSLSHRRLLEFTASRSSPLTSHVRE